MSRPSWNNPDYDLPEDEADEYGIDEYKHRHADAAEAAFNRSIDEGLRRMERLFGKDWLMEGALQEKTSHECAQSRQGNSGGQKDP